MAGWLGSERRSGDRIAVQDKFRCQLSGKQIQALVVNISPTGAYMEIERVIRPGAVMVVEPIRAALGSAVVQLAVRVVRFQIAPTMGVGLEWVRAVSADGLAPLRRFLLEYLAVSISEFQLQRLSPAELERPLSFDFKSGQLSFEKACAAKQKESFVSMFGLKVSERTMARMGEEVRVVQSEAPRQKRAIVNEEEVLAGRDDSAVSPQEAARGLEEWLRHRRQGRPFNNEVVLAFDGSSHTAQALSLSTSNLFVQSSRQLPAEGKRLLVRLLLQTANGRVQAIAVGEVSKLLHDPASRTWGASIRIISVNEGENPGVFARFVGTL